MLRAAVLGTSLAFATSTSQLTVQVKRDGSLIMPHSFARWDRHGTAGFGSSLLIPTEYTTHELCFPSDAGIGLFQWTSQNRHLVVIAMVPCNTGVPVDEPEQAVFTSPQRLVILLFRSRRS